MTMYLCPTKLFSFWKATSIPNFSYMGARLCNYLSHHLTISPQSGNFRQLLLKRSVWIYEIKGNLLLKVLEFDHSFFLKAVHYRKLQERIRWTILFCILQVYSHMDVYMCIHINQSFSVMVSAFGFALRKVFPFPRS